MSPSLWRHAGVGFRSLLYGVELTKGSVRQRGCSRRARTARSLLRRGRFYPARIKKG
jgi:hypothetical protein